MTLRLIMLAFMPLHVAAESPMIEWDSGSLRLLVPGGGYGRMHELPDGHLLLCSQLRGAVVVLRSQDKTRTWSQPAEVTRYAHGIAANPELCPLRDGRVIALWNERPRELGGPHNFTIRMSVSTDSGQTWEPRSEPVFIAGNTMQTACWEPAAIEMPDGEVRLFFSHEIPGQQETLMMSSRDAGGTWTQPRQVSLRPHRRDGMAVPLLLKDGRIVFSVEDNGIAGQDRPHPPFRPSIIDYERADRWMALKELPPDKQNLAAPYLARMPGGQTLLSVQTNADDPRWHRMAVFIGDEQARNFTHRSLPFGLPPETNSEWNSLCVIGADQIIALSSTTIHGQRGLWSVTGRFQSKVQTPE
jgi:hypothetical protein